VKSLDLFMPWVVPYVTGAPDPLVKQMVLDACIEFCAGTTVVQSVSTYSLEAGTAEYPIDVPTQQRLSRIIAVYVGTEQLRSVPVEEVRHGGAIRSAVDTDVSSDVGTPRFFYQPDPLSDSVFLWPVPEADSDNTLAIQAAFEPTRSSTSVADALYDFYVGDIANGALARLMNIPNWPFSNPQLAAQYKSRFSSAIADTLTFSKVGTVRATSRVQPRAFA
jgi:hypothetical protein